jgi:hypothetical protein
MGCTKFIAVQNGDKEWQWIVNKVASKVSRETVLMISAGGKKSSAGSSNKVVNSKSGANRDRKNPTPASAKM